jgi:hypothetical protein
VTTDRAIGRREVGLVGSVRQRLSAIPRAHRLLLGILALVVIVHGWRAVLPFYIRGDLLYHWGLTETILLGAFPPEGPYAGLPAYYPPGFHLILAGLAQLPGLDVRSVTMLLGILWLPVIPVGAYLLARRVSGRTDVAVIAAAMTAFAGGFDISNDRLWVNSLSMAGQIAYPVYPRDLVFGLLPFAMLAFIRAVDGQRRWLAWAAIAGLLLGICGLIQVQLLLPIPFALVAYVAVTARRDRSRWRTPVRALLATGLVTVALVLPWLAYIAATIARNGGVSIDSSEDLLPARIGFWAYPIQFGLVLPLALAGAGLVLLLMRSSREAQPTGSLAAWSRRSPGRGALLLVWWALPFALAIAYQPTWPLEDALRPQRLWLVASQPGLILAAMGLVALIDAVRARRSPLTIRAPRWAVPVTLAILLVMSLPGTVATARLMTFLWVEPRYAHLALERDHVPDFGRLLDVRAPRPTVLTYEDWSSLVWYETGAAVVAVEPPGFAKLAFDPERFTGTSQARRRTDLATALSGDVGGLVGTADRYAADTIVLARRDGAVGLIGQPASLAAALGTVAGPTTVVPGNGWDTLVLEPGSSLTLPLADLAGHIDLELRAATEGVIAPDGTRSGARLLVRVGDEPPVELLVPALLDVELSVVATSIERAPGAPVVVEAIDRVILQGVTGFVADPGPPPGWAIEAETPDAVVWRRAP